MFKKEAWLRLTGKKLLQVGAQQCRLVGRRVAQQQAIHGGRCLRACDCQHGGLGITLMSNFILKGMLIF